jgi:hypothetical protein
VEVRSLVSALATKVASCSESLTDQQYHMSLYGLQGMSGDSVEGQLLVTAVKNVNKRFKDTVSR